jgi:hypothetical protein
VDTQLWIDWKVRHGLLTPGCGRGSMRRSNEIVVNCLHKQCGRLPRAAPATAGVSGGACV